MAKTATEIRAEELKAQGLAAEGIVYELQLHPVEEGVTQDIARLAAGMPSLIEPPLTGWLLTEEERQARAGEISGIVSQAKAGATQPGQGRGDALAQYRAAQIAAEQELLKGIPFDVTYNRLRGIGNWAVDYAQELRATKGISTAQARFEAGITDVKGYYRELGQPFPATKELPATKEHTTEVAPPIEEAQAALETMTADDWKARYDKWYQYPDTTGMLEDILAGGGNIQMTAAGLREVVPSVEEAQAALETMNPERWDAKYGKYYKRPESPKQPSAPTRPPVTTPVTTPGIAPQPPSPGALPVTDELGNIVGWVTPSAAALDIVAKIKLETQLEQLTVADLTAGEQRQLLVDLVSTTQGIETDLEKLWATVRREGRTPETVKALELLGATPQEINQIFAETAPYRSLVNSFIKLFPVFADLGDKALEGALGDNLEFYLDAVRFKGRNTDTVAFLRALDPSLNPLMRDYEPRLNAFFGTDDTTQATNILKRGGVSDVEITKILQQNQLGFSGLNAQAPVPAEGFWKDVGQALYTGTVTASFKTGKFFTSVLPELLYPEDYNQDIRNKFREISANAQNQFDFWIEKHPELAKPEAFKGNPLENPSLLKNPKFLVYTFAEMLPFTLSILGTSTAVTLATGGNLPLGIAAAFAVAVPMQTQDVYDDLIANGAPEDRAALLALPAGMLISALDSVGNLPVLNAISKPSTLLTDNIKRSVIRQIATNLMKKGAKVAGQELLTETLTEDMQQVIQNAVVNAYNKDRSLFDGIGETTIKTLIATAPFALFGGAVSMRGVTPERVSQVSANERQARGWQQDTISGQWFEPKPLVDMFTEDLHSFEELGLTKEEATVKALNEVAKTPEGASAISRIVETIQPTETGGMGGLRPPLTTQPPVPTSKEPWQMTKAEAISSRLAKLPPGSDETIARNNAIKFHRQDVTQAVREGKSVPAEVLADYPALKKKASGKTPNLYGLGKAILSEDMTIGDWWLTGQSKEELLRAFGEKPLKNSVGLALSEGKPVPAEVLADYPELVKVQQVVKAEPAPAVRVYHGTDMQFQNFDIGKSKKWGKFALWFTDNKDLALSWGKNIKEADINLSNPKVLTDKEWYNIQMAHAKDAEWFSNWKTELRKQGFDGLKIEQLGIKGEKVGNIWAVFDNEKVVLPTTTFAPAVTAKPQAQNIPATEPGQPEAGLQPSMLPEDVADKEVRPKGKGRLVQISMDDQLKLKQAENAAEAQGLKDFHEQDPVANYRFPQTVTRRTKQPDGSFKLTQFTRNVGLDSLIPPGAQALPEYFTVKQAQALDPNHDWSHYTQKGTKDYNKISPRFLLDGIAQELGFDYTGGIDDLVNRVNQIRAERRRITELSKPVTIDEIAIEEAEPFQEAVSQGEPPSEAPPPPAQTLTVPRELPEPARDSEIKRIITQSEEQVRQDQPKVITNLLHKIPGLKQLAEFERPGLKMTGEKEKVLVALVAEQAARSDVSVWAMGTRLKLLLDIREVYGKDVLRGAKSDISFIGTPEQATNPITGTLKDIADNPELYDLSLEQLRVLADINIHNDQLLDWVVSNYGAEIGHWTPKPDGAYLPNVDKGEDVVEWLGSETRAVSQGRGKTRVWATARDRMGGKTPFVPELDVQKLLEGLDDFKSKAAAGQTYKTAIGGLNRLEAMETTHPELFARMTDLKRELTSLRGSKSTLEANIQTAIDDFMASPMEDTDLLNLKDNLDVSLKSGIRKGMDLTDVEGKIGNVQDQIDAIRPAWKVANLKPYVFVQEGLYRYFPSDQAQLILESRATTKNRLLGFIEKWRGQAFSGDFSPFTIQGVVGVLADPWGSLRAGAGGVKAAIQHRDLLRSVSIEALADDVANNPVEWGEFASLMGRSLTGVPREYAAGFLSKIPGFDKFTENTFVTVTRGSFNLWQRNYTNMVRHGVPVLEAKVASADIASKVYPLVSQTRLGQSQARHAVLRALPTSYSFIRQPVNLTSDALRGITKLATFQKLTPSESMAVKVAITGAASTLAVSATSAFISALALGKDDDEAWQAALDAINPHPMNGKFASIIIGNVRIPLGGPYRALFRAFYPAQVKGVPFPVPFAGLSNYARNRITPAIRTQLDLAPAIIGKPEAAVDYNKVQIFNTKDGSVLENILRGLEYEFENFLPLALGTAAEAIRQGDKSREPIWQQVLGQFMGVNPVTLDNTYIDRQIKQLGMPKVGEAKPFTIQKPSVYGTKDLYGDVSYVLRKRTGEGFHDKPLTLEIKEVMALKETADGYLNVKLTSLTDDQWALLQQRQDLADTTEFDKVNPQLANISQRDYILLRERQGITDKKELAEFDKAHPELSLNPRQGWLKTHPKENAQLAIWGLAKILSKAAYDEFQKLVKELDIPDSALPELILPPEGSVDNYFKYLDMENKNSWEAQLVLAQDDDLREFLGRLPIDTPVASLELKVKNRDLSEQYDALQKDEERRQFKIDHPDWVDDTRRIEAIENEADDRTIEAWVKRGQESDKFGASSAEAKVWLLDNPEVHKWALDNELLTDDGSDWNVPVLRLDVKWAKEDAEYDGLSSALRQEYLATHPEYNDARRQRAIYLEDKNVSPSVVSQFVEYGKILDQFGANSAEATLFRLDHPDLQVFGQSPDTFGWDDLRGANVPALRLDAKLRDQDKIYDALRTAQARVDYLAKNEDYRLDRLRRQAYQKDIPLGHIENYVQYQELPTAGYRQERFLVEYPGLAQAMGILDPDASKIPSVKYDELLEKPNKTPADFIRMDAYKALFPDNQIENYVKYNEILLRGRPQGQDYWYEDDWFLMEHPEFYKEAQKLGVLKKKDFSRVPTRKVFALYQQYDSLETTGKERLLFRHNNPDLETWMVNVLGYAPVGDRWKEVPPKTTTTAPSAPPKIAPARKVVIPSELRPKKPKAPPKPSGLSDEWKRRLAEMEARLAGVK